MKRILSFFALLILPSVAWGQMSVQGLPPFGSIDQGAFDSTNRQSLNTNIEIPLYSGSGRGLGLEVKATYNSAFWTISNNAWVATTVAGGAPSWGWNSPTTGTFLPAGYVSYLRGTQGSCGAYGGHQIPNAYFSDFTYYDADGTAHPFPTVAYEVSSCTGTVVSGSTAGPASDESGYYLNALSGEVISPSGIQIDAEIQDTNGNFVSSSTSSGTTTWTDSAGRAALKVVTGSSSFQYEYQDTTGTYQTVTLNLQSFNIKTSFGCSGISEYSGTASLPVSVVYPNGTEYTITYEGTPGDSGYYTGRISKLTLPDGGYIEYQYGSTNDGINCADGTILSLTRTVYDGTNTNVWTFSRSPSGSNWVTTVTAPQMPYDTAANQSVYTFNSSGQELSAKYYQGSSSSGTLLRTVNTTWASNGSPATKITILDDNSTQSEIETTYDNYGNLDVLKEHDYGSGSPGAVLRTTSNTYLSSSAYTNLNIVDRVTEETIADSTGTVQYREDTAYDGTTISPCPTGVTQHNDTSYGCSFTTRGNPTSKTTYTNASAPSGGVTKNSYYDVFGNRVKADADCCVTMSWNFSATTEYSSPDSVVRGPSGTQLTTSYTYNAYTGQIASIEDPNNQTTSFAYDLMRRPTTTTRPDSAQIVVSYDDTHHTTTTQNPIQGTSVLKTTAYLDGLGRTYQTSIFDASNNLYSSTTTEYDGLDRPYNVSNPYTSSPQYWTETTFDAVGRELKALLPDGSQTKWMYSAASITTTDPVGNQRKYQADGLNRLSITYEPDPTNNNSLTLQTSYSYTVLDQLATLTQGSQTRTYYYDGMGRLTSHALPESGTTSFQYNSYNQISQRTDARGVITTYSYDAMNRPYQISYNVGSTGVAATPTVTYAYGTSASQLNNGRILTLTDGLGTTTYTYDNLARTTQAQYVISGSTYTVGYQYNLAGEVTTLTYPSTRAVQRTYDAIGRLASISDSSTTYANSFSYNAAQQRTNFTYGNGVAATIGFTPDRLQKQSIQFAGGSTVYNVSYSRTQNGGNNGQITGITDSVDSGRSIGYTYDSLGRLSTAVTTGDSNYPQWGMSFTYDRYGNRTAQTVTAGTAPSSSVNVSATTNHITTSGYSYDLNGNVTNDGVNALSYDAENRLLTASGSYGSGTYSYGAFGIRAVKTSSGSTTVSVYDGNRIIAEYTNGTLANEYVYIGGKLIASRLSGTLYYHAFDHQSIRVHLDASGNIVGQKGQYPYGEDWYPSSISNRHFTSYVRDPESVNDNALHRFYINRLGRFSATDPLPGGGGNPQGFNLYNYVHNDPVDHRDPTGTHLISYGDDDDDDDGGGGGGGGGGGYGGGGIPCDPTIDPTCGCNGNGFEGNSCPPPEPTPNPVLPTPECSLEVKYHHIPLVPPARHTFWYVVFQGLSLSFSAGPEHLRPPFGYLREDNPNNTVGKNLSTDTTYTPYSFGPAQCYCYNAALMYGLAQLFVGEDYHKYKYGAAFGPNSNSFTRALGEESLLPVTFLGPPRAAGWNYPLTIP
jgi:RHS repeat-associated protein